MGRLRVGGWGVAFLVADCFGDALLLFLAGDFAEVLFRFEAAFFVFFLDGDFDLLRDVDGLRLAVSFFFEAVALFVRFAGVRLRVVLFAGVRLRLREVRTMRAAGFFFAGDFFVFVAFVAFVSFLFVPLVAFEE